MRPTETGKERRKKTVGKRVLVISFFLLKALQYDKNMHYVKYKKKTTKTNKTETGVGCQWVRHFDRDQAAMLVKCYLILF